MKIAQEILSDVESFQKDVITLMGKFETCRSVEQFHKNFEIEFKNTSKCAQAGDEGVEGQRVSLAKFFFSFAPILR